MEGDGNGSALGDESPQNLQSDGEASFLSGNLFLDHVGEVTLTQNPDGLSWKLLESSENESRCLGFKLVPRVATEIKFSDVYAVEFSNCSLMHGSDLSIAGKCFLSHGSVASEMFCFTVHGFQRSQSQPCLWVLAAYTFGHKDLQTCQMWVNQVNASLKMQIGRPKSLLVLVNPMSGKANGCNIWEKVAPIFSRAKVKTKVIVTLRAGHAHDIMVTTTNKELNSYDGVVAVGGDGFFNEILNGFLSLRHKVPYPPTPSDFACPVHISGSPLVPEPEETVAASHQSEDHPLLVDSSENGSRFLNLKASDDLYHADQDPDFPLGNEWFRFGLIPAGSTDAIVICTTGARDPITSALHIVLGKRVCLDVAQVVRWKTKSTSKVEPFVRYAASFAGYGFYGDVITESEKLRWMGPKRYDIAGTKVFLTHRSYEAEVAYLEVESEKPCAAPDNCCQQGRIWPLRSTNKSERVVCQVNCIICNTKPIPHAKPYSRLEETRWKKSKGCFLSVAAALISNRNERAPDGLVVDAHLSDGFLHLILIKDCPRAMYLWHLTQLAKKGGTPLNFDFVEYHKTTAFTFTSFGKESVWNLDGELFEAHQLSAQVFQGLVWLFASGPEV